MSALGIAILAPLLWMVAFATRRGALLALFAGLLYLTMGQTVNVFGIDLYATRLLMLATFLRVIVRGEFGSSQLNGLDKTLLLVFGYRAVVFVVNSNGSPMTEIGYFADTFLAYFAFRGLIRETEDLKFLLTCAPLLLLPYAALSAVERWTGSNVFASLGGVPGRILERGGIPRAAGSFTHPSIFGTLGAILLPLYIAFAFDVRNRVAVLIGMASCAIIVFVSNSGGPATAAAMAILGWFAWGLRMQMRLVRWLLVSALVFLAGVMKAPIWSLPAKISALLGGDGWHRSYLMQVTFEHLGDWWFAGMSVLETRDWFPYVVVTGGADIINYYLEFGIAAGLPAMILFIFFLATLFGRLGAAMQVVRSRGSGDLDDERILWGLGVAVFVHVVNWFAIVYFDKMHLILCMQFAAISSLVSSVGRLENASAAWEVRRPTLGEVHR